MRRRNLLALVASAVAPVSGHAQASLPTVGYLGARPLAEQVATLEGAEGASAIPRATTRIGLGQQARDRVARRAIERPERAEPGARWRLADQEGRLRRALRGRLGSHAAEYAAGRAPRQARLTVRSGSTSSSWRATRAFHMRSPAPSLLACHCRIPRSRASASNSARSCAVSPDQF